MTSLRALVRTPVVAAFLSFVFPGLGQAAVGRRSRAAVVAIPALVTVGVLILVYLFDRRSLFSLALNDQLLSALLVLDLLLLVYHSWAVVDAYLIAGATRRGIRSQARLPIRQRASTSPAFLSLAGVALILSTTVAVHGAVAMTDANWQHALYCITARTPCWVTADTRTPAPLPTGMGSDELPYSKTPGTSGSQATPSPLQTIDIGALPSFTTTGGPWTWNPNGELNVLLAGIGVQDDPSQLGPDTIMVLHADRNTGRASLISIGRNNVCVPLPQGIAQNFASSTNGCPPYTWPWMINALPNTVLGSCQYFPLYADTCGQPGDPNRYLRAYRVFEQVIGTLTGLSIDGSVWVNPTGLTRLLDDVGGVEINVPTQVVDMPCGPAGTWQAAFANCAYTHNGYSVPTGVKGVNKMKTDAALSGGLQSITWSKGQDIAMIIQPGYQHMDGDWALAYARTRMFSGGGDFDRAARQQQVLKAVRTQLDPCQFSSAENVVSLLGTLTDIPYAFNTDMPITNPDDLHEWASLAKRVLGGDIKSVVLDPTTASETWLTVQGVQYPAVDARSWAAIKSIVAGSLEPSPSASSSAGSPSSSSTPGGC